MSKKGFKSEFGPLLGHTTQTEDTKNSQEKQKSNDKANPSNDIQKEAKNTVTRATFIVEEELLEKIKSIAYWDRLQIKDVVNRALSDYITRWENQNGVVKLIEK